MPSAPETTTKVWDPFVRVFHWSLVVLFTAAYLTSEIWERGHIVIGYAIAALVGLRVVWGFVGTRHARFSDFIHGPRAVIAYVRDDLAGRARRYIGHNPAGGAMIIALIAALSATCGAGYLMTTDAFWGVKWLEEVHEFSANATVGLVALHVLGVIYSSVMHGENLVRAMITGRKRAP
ncbi:MAG: cytochrome b/b6 domain-containing protein [Hyphomicrobiaceae bacterium]